MVVLFGFLSRVLDILCGFIFGLIIRLREIPMLHFEIIRLHVTQLSGLICALTVNELLS